jgi:hypothetical protein
VPRSLPRRLGALLAPALAAAALARPAAAQAAGRPAAPPAAPPAAAAPVPSSEDPRIHEIAAGASAARVEADVRRLAAFGTRHTMSDTLSATRGIGAARRWVHDEFRRIAQACGGCLEVRYVSDVVKADPQSRVRQDVNMVNVVAVQRGRTDPDRYVLVTGHLDSRATDVMTRRSTRRARTTTRAAWPSCSSRRGC